MYNEVYNKSKVRKFYNQIYDWAKSLPENVVVKKKNEAENLFKKIGITFSVYNNFDSTERLIPFDMFPRIISSTEWKKIKKGVIQRALAINAFLNDIYNSGEIIKAKLIPANLIYKNPAYEVKMIGFKVPKKIYSPIIGSDIVRINENIFKVLEDNCRTPSGVSYMIENREIMMRMFPELFEKLKIETVENYPSYLLDVLKSLAPKKCNKEPKVVILTPGSLNSAYYEHSFLADLMGVELVQGTDLFVDESITYMKTTRGPEKVDIIYRRIDDQFIGKIKGLKLELDLKKGALETDIKSLKKAARQTIGPELEKRVQSIIDTGLISLNEDFKIYWNDFPIAKLTTGNDYLNPNFDLIVDDVIEKNTKQKLNDFINKWIHSKINNVLKSLIDLKNYHRNFLVSSFLTQYSS